MTYPHASRSAIVIDGKVPSTRPLSARAAADEDWVLWVVR